MAITPALTSERSHNRGSELRRIDQLPESDTNRYASKIVRTSQLLTAEQEVELAQTIEAGLLARAVLESTASQAIATDDELQLLVNQGRAAFSRLVASNIRLVLSIARKYANVSGLAEYSDLVQSGTIGLIYAAKRFDFAKGFKFSTYSAWWIRKAIAEEVGSNRVIRLSPHVILKVNQIAKATGDLSREFGREPTNDEVAAELSMDAGKLREFQTATREAVSLNAHLSADSDSEVGDGIEDPISRAPDENLVHEERAAAVHDALRSLDTIEARILLLRFGIVSGIEASRVEVAASLDLSVKDTRDLEMRAIAKLNHPSRSGLLRSHL